MTFSQVAGQEQAVSTLRGMADNGRVPSVLLLSGPSGTGKTTLARIVAQAVGCNDHDLHEYNAADFRGIDTVRDIRQRMGLAPLGGGRRVFIIDEAHGLTRQAQEALLKALEECPKHVHFMLCSTAPEKLLKTIQTRCVSVRCKPVGADALRWVVDRVVDGEGLDVGEDVRDKVVTAADGSARAAVKLLEAVREYEDEDSQLSAVQSTAEHPQAIELCRLLLRPRGDWKSIATVLQSLEGEDPEGIRYMVLGYMRKVLLSGNPRAAAVLGHFVDNWYDSKHAGLALACWEATHG